MKKILAIFASAVLLFCTKNAYGQLAKTVHPLFYDLTLDIDTTSDQFDGSVVIVVNVEHATNNITLHAVGLTFSQHTITNNDSSQNFPSTVLCNATHEICSINLNEAAMPKGIYNISIKYTGKFSTDMKGLYTVEDRPYRYRFGIPKTMAITDFQPRYARRVFPCFDDPQFLTNFSISIKRDEKYTAISNTPVVYNKALEDGRIQDFFEVATKLATRQVAFVVGKFVHIPYTKGDIYTVYTPYYHKLATFIRNISDIAIKAMEDFIPLVLPMKKIDIVTIGYLRGSVGGLSNWGLISLSRNSLIGKEKVTKVVEEEYSLLAITRVLSQQFFGNVVFVSDVWSSVWLSNGLADYFKYWIANKVYPEWLLLKQRNLHIIRSAVENDISVTSPSLPIDKYPEFRIHQEASAIMLTLEGLVGTQCFLESIRFFVQKYAALVPIPEDFWAAMEDSNRSEKNSRCLAHIQDQSARIVSLAGIMERWTKQLGVPVVQAFRNYSAKSEITFTQKRLIEIQGAEPAAWYIPINIVTKSKPSFNDFKPVVFLDPAIKTKRNVTYPISDEWFIINPEVAYYYLVNYDNTNWKRLAHALNSETFGKMQPETRGKLLFDAFTLARHKLLKYDVALEFIKYLRREKDYIVLNTFFHVFDYFYNKYSGIKNFKYLQEFVANSLQPALEHVGFYENKSIPHTQQHIDNLNRLQLIKWACKLGNRFCRNTATRILKEWQIFPMSHDLQEIVVCAGLIDADEVLWNGYGEYFYRDESHSRLSIALGCTRNESNLLNYIGTSLRYNISVFDEVYSRGYFGVNFVLEYIVRNGRKVKESLISRTLKRIFTELTNHISTKEQLEKLKLASFALELTELTSEDFSPEKDINRLSKELEDASLDSNDISQWIMNEIINEGKPDRASLCVLIVMMLFSSLF